MRDASLDEFVDPEPGDGDGDESEADRDESEVEADEAETKAEKGTEPGSEDSAVAGDSDPDVNEAGEGVEGADSEDGEDAEPPSPEAVDPAEPTLDFAPGGADCEGCGEAVRRRWRDGDAMVCADCKEW